MTQTVGIVGAGLMGRLLALALAEQDWRVSLFEKDGATVPNSCGYAGAGMLSPISELETSEPLIARLGFDSLPLWERLIQKLDLPVYFQNRGTLIVAHHLDAPELAHFSRRLKSRIAQCKREEVPQKTVEEIEWRLSGSELRELEPQLGERFQQGVFIPEEGQIDNRQLLISLEHQLNRANVHWHCHTRIEALKPHEIDDGGKKRHFDWVIDCRGLGAKPDWRQLRGVRGEIIRVHAPEVSLQRPVRLMHPRYPLYIAPRENHHFVIGATSIESEDFRPITLQSGLELMSAAFTVHPGFAEATLLESMVNCRPALPDHLPAISMEPGLIRSNGLYRHGFLMAPKLAELVCCQLRNEVIPSLYQSIFHGHCENLMNQIPREAKVIYASTH